MRNEMLLACALCMTAAWIACPAEAIKGSSGAISSGGTRASSGARTSTASGASGTSGTSYASTSYRVYTPQSSLYTGSLGYRTYPIMGVGFYGAPHRTQGNNTAHGSANYTGAEQESMRGRLLLGRGFFRPLISLISLISLFSTVGRRIWRLVF